MRAFVVEFASDEAQRRAILPGVAVEAGTVARGEGGLAPRPVDPATVDRSSGEPL
jgi:hypothetical protein